MNVSHHAVERYQARWTPTLSLAEAGVQLRALANVAKPIRETSRRKGHELWAVGEVKLVVTRNTTDRTPLVVTVLPLTPSVDVDTEMQAYLDEEAAQPSGATLQAILDAREAYAQAGRDIFVANALVGDGKTMLEDAERRRLAARDTLIRLQGEP